MRVIFLTCNVGNSPDFLRKLANDSGVVVVAYTQRDVCTKIATTSPGRAAVNQYCLHLDSENLPFAIGEPNIIAQEEVPLRPDKSVISGPPLP